MQQQITLNPPSRETMRLVFELAIRQAQHPSTQRSIADAYNYFELVWEQESKQRGVEATESGETAEEVQSTT